MYCPGGSRASAISDGWRTVGAEIYSLCVVAYSNSRCQWRTQPTKLKDRQSGDVLSAAGPCTSWNNSAPPTSTSSRYPLLTPRKPPPIPARIGCPFTSTVHVCLHHKQPTTDNTVQSSFPPPTLGSASTTVRTICFGHDIRAEFPPSNRFENP